MKFVIGKFFDVHANRVIAGAKRIETHMEIR